MKHSALQVPALHTSPVAQLVPSASLLHAVVLAVGWQLWQALPGFAAAGAYTVAPMKHPGAHVPALQTEPAPQLVPFASLVHAEVLAPGWQLWQALPGSAAPEATIVPPMSHCVPQAPEEHTCPLPQLVPSATSVHVVTLAPGWQLWQALFGSGALAA
jgi:hypothetical protein